MPTIWKLKIESIQYEFTGGDRVPWRSIHSSCELLSLFGLVWFGFNMHFTIAEKPDWRMLYVIRNDRKSKLLHVECWMLNAGCWLLVAILSHHPSLSAFRLPNRRKTGWTRRSMDQQYQISEQKRFTFFFLHLFYNIVGERWSIFSACMQSMKVNKLISAQNNISPTK